MCNHTDSIDLQKYKNVYFIGIGGSSMSSLAMILKRRGCVVRGYDRAHTRETEMLQNSGIPVYDTTDASHFDGAELIVYTVAFAPDHPEMVLAAQRGVPVIPRARLLEAIAADYPNSIGIAGTHGKSTTSGMTAQIFLSEEHADPTVLIGAALPGHRRGLPPSEATAISYLKPANTRIPSSASTRASQSSSTSGWITLITSPRSSS